MLCISNIQQPDEQLGLRLFLNNNINFDNEKYYINFGKFNGEMCQFQSLDAHWAMVLSPLANFCVVEKSSIDDVEARPVTLTDVFNRSQTYRLAGYDLFKKEYYAGHEVRRASINGENVGIYLDKHSEAHIVAVEELDDLFNQSSISLNDQGQTVYSANNGQFRATIFTTDELKSKFKFSYPFPDAATRAAGNGPLGSPGCIFHDGNSSNKAAKDGHRFIILQQVSKGPDEHFLYEYNDKIQFCNVSNTKFQHGISRLFASNGKEKLD
ncbi:MAG: hypothetical protein Q8K75_07410 [Chlamydiales bacterium]|nr:hypothetical protein [Chlamydiales bacterium]